VTAQPIPVLPDRTRARVVLGGLGAGYLLALAAVYAATVLTVPGRRVSDASLRGALNTRSTLSGSVHAVLDVVSVGSLVLAMAVIAVIALLRLAGRAGVVALGLLVAANASTWLLKNYLLPRPDLGLHEAAPETLNSLPSGHATAAFSAAAALVLVLPVALRRVGAVVGALVGALVAVATMAAGWHRAGDALAAFCVVGFWTVAAAWVLLHGRTPSAQAGDAARWRPPRRTFGVAVVGLAAGAAVAALLATTTRDTTGAPVTWTALLAGVLVVLGGAAAAMLGILRAVELTGTGR
jgi:membrane-associated phospholipid phosphatase